MNRRRTSAIRPLAVIGLIALALGPRPAAGRAGPDHGRATSSGGSRTRAARPLPGATVTATKKETGFTRSTVTEADGTYRLPSLPVGAYTVRSSSTASPP